MRSPLDGDSRAARKARAQKASEGRHVVQPRGFRRSIWRAIHGDLKGFPRRRRRR